MEKDLILAGLPVRFTASDEDFYLQALPVDGDTDLEAVFREFCQPGDDFVDVGANIGVTAVLAARVVDPGRVVAVEPVPSTFSYLQHNIASSGLAHVTCRQLAVASTPGEVSLVSRPGFGFAAYVGHAAGLAGYADHPASALPLDQLVADEGLEHLRFVKIDVEGYELEVLRGATAVLHRCQPVVFLESNHYCLNIFHQISLVDFAAEILSIFPFVYALDFTSGLSVFDLTVRGNLPAFYHESVVSNGFANLVCGFDPDMRQRLQRIQDRKADAAARALDRADQERVADGSITMTVSRRERESILLKRRVMNTIKGRVSPPAQATP
jgi:FkbM family methyltransferase